MMMMKMMIFIVITGVGKKVKIHELTAIADDDDQRDFGEEIC